MGKYFNIIEAMFQSLGQVKDLILIGWILLWIVVACLISFVSMAISPVLWALMLPVGWAVGFFFLLKIHQRVMVVQKMPQRPDVSFVSWVWLCIRRLLVDIFCWYDKKLLIPVVLGIIIGFGALVMVGASALSNASAKPGSMAFGGPASAGMTLGAGVGLMAAIFVLFIWFFVSFGVHSTRTKFAAWNYLSGRTDSGKAIIGSNALIKGQTIEAFLPSALNLMTMYFTMYILIIPAYFVGIMLLALVPVLAAILAILFVLAIGIVACALFGQVMIIEAGLFRYWSADEMPKAGSEAPFVPMGAASAMRKPLAFSTPKRVVKK